MSSDTPEDIVDDFFDVIEPLIEYSSEIYSLREDVYEVFKYEFKHDDNIKSNFNEFFTRIDLALAPEIEVDERHEVTEALINAVSQLGREEEKELRKEYDEKELAELLRKLKRRHGNAVTRRIKREYEGTRWWSNIKTNPKFRAGKPVFTHEITVDNRKLVEIDSGIGNILNLAIHLVSQFKNAQETHGKDAFDYVDVDQIEDLSEDVEESLERVKQYKNTVDSEDVKETEEEESKEQ